MDADALLAVLALSSCVQRELEHQGGAAVLGVLRDARALVAEGASEEQEGQARRLHELAELAYARCWERLHCGSWKDIAPVWREVFGVVSVLKAWCLHRDNELQQCLRMLDMCLMMAGPMAPPATHQFVAIVEQKLPPLQANPSAADSPRACKRLRIEEKPTHSESVSIPAIHFPVERVKMPSLQDFHRKIMASSEPVIITGAMDNWPALGVGDNNAQRNWSNVEYFRRVAGRRTVPVEVGSSYLEDDWSQELMTVSEFLDKFIVRSVAESGSGGRKVGYLAQHHLFEQIPVLGRDIMTPDYCILRRSDLSDNPDFVSDEHDEDEDIAVNAWFGPEGTVSPLHFDPKDNLLCQVVGAKYLRLYSPSESSKLYPVDGMLSNTSQVQVEAPKEETNAKFPRFREAKHVECVLKAGEMLYIPPKYWHYVRSLSTSFSVSFWWE